MTSKDTDTNLENHQILTNKVDVFFKNKGFGFLDNGVFFHFVRGLTFTFNGHDEPYYLNINKKVPEQPEKGDELIYEVELFEKGPRARWWGFVDNYNHILKLIEERPFYRLQEKDITLWQGQNIFELNKQFSKKKYPEYEHYLWFEKYEGEQWVKTKDPR